VKGILDNAESCRRSQQGREEIAVPKVIEEDRSSGGASKTKSPSQGSLVLGDGVGQ
jgi:hypothetical protein